MDLKLPETFLSKNSAKYLEPSITGSMNYKETAKVIILPYLEIIIKTQNFTLIFLDK